MGESQSIEKATPRYTVQLSGSQYDLVRYGIVEFLRAHPICRGLVATIGSIAFTADLGFMVLFRYGFNSYAYVCFVAAPLLLWMATVSGPSFQLIFREAKASEERVNAENKFQETRTPEDALDLDFTRLNEYYTINQAQARASFRWAISSMLLGLGTIVAGIWFFYLRTTQPDKFMASLSTAAGIVVNVISGLFLFLYSKTQERSLVYYEQLSRLKRFSLAMQLVQKHQDPQHQTEARNLVIRHLVSEPSRLGVQ